jgi:hypothetical protein
LDDYEQGTWSPTLVAGIFASNDFDSVSYTTQIGRYTKIGNRVFCTFRIVTSSVTIGSADGNCGISGLPFAVSGNDFASGSGVLSEATNYVTNYPTGVLTDPVSSGGNARFVSLLPTSNTISIVPSDISTSANGNRTIGMIVYQTDS